MKKVLVAQVCLTLCDPMDCSLCPWNSPGKNTGVSSHSLLQRIFPNQRLNPSLHIAADSLPSEPPGKYTHIHTHTHTHTHIFPLGTHPSYFTLKDCLVFLQGKVC